MNFKLPRINKYVGMLALAVVLAGLAVFLAYTYLSQKREQYQAELQSQLKAGNAQVVVPVSNLKAGMVVNGSNMAQRLYPRDLIYSGTITTNKWPDYAGRRLARPVQAGKPLLETDFVSRAIADFASTLPKPMRAVTINVNSLNSIAGLIRPDDRVDVLLSGSFGANGRKSEVLPVLHQVRVLATGPHFVGEHRQNNPNGDSGSAMLPVQYGTITLEVTPRQSSELILAQQIGSLRVVLSGLRGEEIGPKVPKLTQTQLLATLQGQGRKSHYTYTRGVQFIIGTPSGVSRSYAAGQRIRRLKQKKSPKALQSAPQRARNQALKALKTLIKSQQRSHPSGAVQPQTPTSASTR